MDRDSYKNLIYKEAGDIRDFNEFKKKKDLKKKIVSGSEGIDHEFIKKFNEPLFPEMNEIAKELEKDKKIAAKAREISKNTKIPKRLIPYILGGSLLSGATAYGLHRAFNQEKKAEYENKKVLNLMHNPETYPTLRKAGKMAFLGAGLAAGVGGGLAGLSYLYRNSPGQYKLSKKASGNYSENFHKYVINGEKYKEGIKPYLKWGLKGLGIGAGTVGLTGAGVYLANKFRNKKQAKEYYKSLIYKTAGDKTPGDKYYEYFDKSEGKPVDFKNQANKWLEDFNKKNPIREVGNNAGGEGGLLENLNKHKRELDVSERHMRNNLGRLEALKNEYNAIRNPSLIKEFGKTGLMGAGLTLGTLGTGYVLSRIFNRLNKKGGKKK